LRRQLMVAVLGTPGFDDLDGAVVALDRELHPVRTITDPDLFEQTAGMAGEGRRFLEHPVDLCGETDLAGHEATCRGKTVRAPVAGRALDPGRYEMPPDP